MRRGQIIPGVGLAQRSAVSSAGGVVPAMNGNRPIVLLLTAPSFTIDDFPTDMIFQRGTGGLTRTMRFSGSVSTAPSAIQVKIQNSSGGATVQDYAALSNLTIEGGVWTGTLSVPASGSSGVGWYKARAKDADTLSETSVQTAQWSVGRRILITGASNMALLWTTQTSGLTGGTYTRWIGRYSTTAFGARYSDGWYSTDKSERGVADSGPRGLNALDVLLRTLAPNVSATETIGIVDLGIPGLSDASDFLEGEVAWEWFTGSEGINYPAIGPDFELILGEHGDPDGVEFSLAHLALLTLLGRTRATLGFGIMVFNSFSSAFISDEDSNSILASLYAKSKEEGFFLAASMRDFVLVDTAHWNDAEYTRCGKRMAIAAAKHWGWSAHGATGPSITAARWPVHTGTITVNISQNSGGTSLLDGAGSATGTGLDGFTVTASGGQTISDVAVASGQAVITMSANRADGETVTLEFAKGANPYGFPFDGTGNVNDVTYDNRASFTTDTQGLPLLATFGTAIRVAAHPRNQQIRTRAVRRGYN